MSTTALDVLRPILPHFAPSNHFVLFYEDEGVLGDSVVQFIESGLDAREPVVIIASAEHCDAFRKRLEKRGANVAEAVASGHFRMLDARETLASFMVDGLPDRNQFISVLGTVIEDMRASFPRGRLRAYGEMVDILCRDGQGEAAIRLEELWNELATKHSFSLFCAYVMEESSSITDVATYERAAALHTHALPGSAESRTHARLRAIADLQQRTRVLEEEIERSKQSDMFRLLVESVTDYAIFVLDARGIVQTWNGGAQRINGYRASEIVGQHFSRFYPQEDVAAGKCEMELESAARDGRFEDEGWRVRKDGTRLWANVIITALRDPNGTLVGFAKVTRDLTERRKAEQELQKAEQERAELAKAQEVNRVREQFLATISHEIRTPLNAIFGWASLLKTANNPNAVEKAAETILRNAEAQLRIVDDMLDLSRIVTGKMRIDVRSVDLTTIVREAIEVVRPAAEAKNIELILEGVDGPMVLVADAVRLQQMTWNFLSNAVKFSPAGGKVTASLRKDGSCLELCVKDTGQGIDPAFLPYVFEPFRQADSGPARRVGGVGLGLAIVKHIVELHGGRVSVASEGIGKGAAFSAMLPIRALVPAKEEARQARAAIERAQSEAVAPLSGVRVLAIDDDPDAREILSMLFDLKGATVHLAASAAEARRALDTFKPDIIVSDIAMPDEDGYSFLRSVRELPPERGGSIPAIALTAYAYAEDRKRVLEAGFNYHLAKPVDHSVLLHAVRNLLDLAARR